MHPQSPALPLTRAGVVVRLNGELRFLSAHSVRRFVPPPAISDVSGTGLTMLLGPEPQEVGFFDAEGSGVSFHGRSVPALDVADLVRSSARAGQEHPEET